MSTSPHLKKTSSGRWRKGGPFILGLVVVVASTVALYAHKGSQKNGPRNTHIVQRSDLIVSVTEKGILESYDNTEIRCKVQSHSVITWVIEPGSYVKPGDELMRLDTLEIEDAISERTKSALWSQSAAERSASDVASSKLAIDEYLEGRYRTQLMGLEKDLAITQSNQLTAQSMLAHAETMAARGYVSELDVEDATSARIRSELTVGVTKKQMEVLQKYTKAMELETLKGNHDEARARHAANVERAKMNAIRRDQAIEELGHSVITAEQSGLVIYPRAERWKRTPQIEEGAHVHRNQVLLIMPNLTKMQVKIGIHESVIGRIKPGLGARIKLPDQTLDGEVTTVAEVTAPAGWWTGNVVKYETVVELPVVEGLKPGMSADVEVMIDLHEDALTLPVNAVLQTTEGFFCWVHTAEGVNERRALQLGDTDEESVVIEAGVQAGDEVWLDPLAHIAEAQTLALTPFDKTTQEVDHAK
jgi:HlyD family secretion protein